MSASSSKSKLNLRSTAVKRIMQEAAELGDSDEDDFVAAPLETDIFEWHCTMRGVRNSEYEGGLYHLRILLPPSYPMSAPDIILLTPNGRFELGKKICIDGLTSFHAGSWQPAWGVRTAILGLRSFWMQAGEALSAIGALDCSKEERKRLARLSKNWICPTCGEKNESLLSVHPNKRKSTSSTFSNHHDSSSTILHENSPRLISEEGEAEDELENTALSDPPSQSNENIKSASEAALNLLESMDVGIGNPPIRGGLSESTPLSSSSSSHQPSQPVPDSSQPGPSTSLQDQPQQQQIPTTQNIMSTPVVSTPMPIPVPMPTTPIRLTRRQPPRILDALISFLSLVLLVVMARKIFRDPGESIVFQDL